MIPALRRWNGDHALTKDSMKGPAVAAENLLFDDWFDAIEDGVRARVRGFIEAMLEEELGDVLARPRYGRRKAGDAPPAVVGCRHGHRKRSLTGTFGKTEISVPRARLVCEDDGSRTHEWKSRTLRAYQRRTQAADALIAGAYLAGTNTRRVRRALYSVFAGAVGKDVVSRTWRKVKGDWDLWNKRPSLMARTRSARTRVSRLQYEDEQTRSNNGLATQVDPHPTWMTNPLLRVSIITDCSFRSAVFT